MNDPILPSLEITGPNGQLSTVFHLTKSPITIGRYPFPFNDISLQPDPQQYITRETHCTLDHRGSGWYIVSNGKNATLLDQGKGRHLVQHESLLSDGDRVYIQGGISETKQPQFWTILFRDPEGTHPTDSVFLLKYEEASKKVFTLKGGKRSLLTIPLRESKLICYMLSRNRENNDIPVLISIDELMNAVWGDEAVHRSPEELHKLIFTLRKEIEPDPKAPRVIVNDRGRGYILHTCLLPFEESDGGGGK